MSDNVTLVALGLLVLRIALGVVLFAHGAQKVLGWFGGHGLKGTIGFFKSAWNIPPAFGYIGAFTEFLGSVAVLAGFLTKLTALGLFVEMIVALYVGHRRNGFFMNWGAEANKYEGYEFTATLALVALALVLIGAGAYSVDATLW